MKVNVFTLWDDPDCGNYKVRPTLADTDRPYWTRVSRHHGWLVPTTDHAQSLACDEYLFASNGDVGTVYGRPVVIYANFVTLLGNPLTGTNGRE